VTLQVVVHGYDARQPSAFLALVDSATLRQLECELDWRQATELAWLLVDASSRWRPMGSEHGRQAD
jgi:hypothetical protein